MKPLSVICACFFLHTDFPSPVLPIWGLFGKQKKKIQYRLECPE